LVSLISRKPYEKQKPKALNDEIYLPRSRTFHFSLLLFLPRGDSVLLSPHLTRFAFYRALNAVRGRL
jgi:hypothetical protein